MCKIVMVKDNITYTINLNVKKIQEEFVLSMIGLMQKDGRILHSGNISEYLPTTILGDELRTLWGYNQNFSFGTERQENILKENGIIFSLKKLKLIVDARECLLKNNLLVDGDITYGVKAIVNPLPNHILILMQRLMKDAKLISDLAS